MRGAAIVGAACTAAALALATAGGHAQSARVPATARPAATGGRAAAGRYAVGLRTITIVERRHMTLHSGRSVPRVLVTYVRYPAVGRPGQSDVRGAPAAVSDAPLVVFGHGYNVTPAPYDALMRAWARAGYVVAAPVFPLENANAPGGPDENDLTNQPGDMSAVITSMLRLSARRDAFHRLIDPGEVAVSGQSDGGETALAAAYDTAYRDTRVNAAMILSGARIPGLDYSFPPGSPPLLATQGLSDTINLPHFTFDFYSIASPPKFLLELAGAPHLPPYTTEQPQLGIVERVTTDFLDRYLRHKPASLARLRRDGNVAGVAVLTADPY